MLTASAVATLGMRPIEATASGLTGRLTRSAQLIGVVAGLVIILSGQSAYADASVSNSGMATYSHPIAVPPGVRQLAPQLSLSYSSGNGLNGPAGYAWSLQGYASVTRCAATRATDGTHLSVAFSANDKLCLDGERLIPLDASGNAVVGLGTGDAAGLGSGAYKEFRTERDSYARVRAYGYADGGAAASGPAYFRVWTKDGKVVDYGSNPITSDINTNATIGAYYPADQTNHYAQQWAVSRIADIFGNHIDFKYTQRDVAWGSRGAYSQGHEWNLTEIQYSGNKILFNYTDRATSGPAQDAAEAYQAIAKTLSLNRLTSITTYTNASNTGALGASSTAVSVSTTKLIYDRGPVTQRSRLISIQTCAGDIASTKCLPPAKFSYSNGGTEAYQKNGNFNLGSTALHVAPDTLHNPPQVFGPKGVLTGDFNGDGRTDIIRWSATASENQLWLSNGDGTFTQATNFNITGDVLFSTDGCTQVIAKDFNGDGLVDVLRFSTFYPQNRPWSCNLNINTAPPSYLFINNGDGTFTKKSIAGSTLIKDRQPNNTASSADPNKGSGTWWNMGQDFYILDVDGDGILDIVTTIRPARAVANAWDAYSNLCASVVCTRVFKGDGQGNFSEISTNLSHYSLFGNDAPPPLGGNAMDYDQDGLPDISILDFTTGGSPSSNYVARSRGDGNFDLIALGGYPYFSLAQSLSIDYNGDGKWDILHAGPCSTSCANTLSVRDSGSVAFSNNSLFNLTTASNNFGGQTVNGATMPVIAIAVDLNGDGRQDILSSIPASSASTAWLSNGDGTFSQSGAFNVGALRQADGTTGSGTAAVMGDFTGRGTPEFLALGPTNALYVKLDASKPDLLTSVTSESGAVSTLTYVPIGNPTIAGDSLGARYIGDRATANAATLPKIDVTPPVYVVATLQVDNGVGGLSKAEYSYFGLKSDTRGRDSLGFRAVRKQTITPNGALHTSETKLLQDFPYIGMPVSAVIYRSALNAASTSNLLSSVASVYCDQTSAAGADATAIANGVSCSSSQVIKRPYLLWSQATAKDLLGYALPTVTTRTAVNANGDPTAVSVVTTQTNSANDTYTKITNNLYSSDNIACSATQTCNWILGRLTQTSTEGIVPTSILTTSPGTATNATATKGTGAPPPLNPAVLSAILQLLLDD